MTDLELLKAARGAVVALRRITKNPDDRWADVDLRKLTDLLTQEVIEIGRASDSEPAGTLFDSLWRLVRPLDRRQLADAEEAAVDLGDILGGPTLDATRKPKRSRDPAIDARGQYLYEQISLRRRPEKVVRSEVNKTPGWPKLNSRQHTFKMLESHRL